MTANFCYYVTMDKDKLARQISAIADFFNKPISRECSENFGITLELSKTHKILENYWVNRETSNKFIEDLHQISHSKIKKAKILTFPLYLLPFVQMIAISGSVGALTAAEEDDIDIFIVCWWKTIWLTRAFDFTLYNLFGLRRRKEGRITKDKLCFNKYASSSSLELGNHDIFTIFQAINLQVIYGQTTYRDFILQNTWMGKFFDVQEYLLKVDSRITIWDRIILVSKKVICIIFSPLIWIFDFIASLGQKSLLSKYDASVCRYDETTLEIFPGTVRAQVLAYLKAHDL